jgi:hypothetical protein
MLNVARCSPVAVEGCVGRRAIPGSVGRGIRAIDLLVDTRVARVRPIEAAITVDAGV